MGFIQNRRLSIFSHWLTMERLQNWRDLRSPISRVRFFFINSVTDINIWKFLSDWSVGVAMTSIQTYLWWGHDVTWWPDLGRRGSENCTTHAEKMHKRVCQKPKRSAPPFFRYLRKTWEEGVLTPASPGGCGLNDITSEKVWMLVMATPTEVTVALKLSAIDSSNSIYKTCISEFWYRWPKAMSI